MVQLTRKRTILAKIETTYGTDPVPTGAANAINVTNINPRPLVADQRDRNIIRPYMGNFQQLNANQHAEVDFDVEISGAGAAGTVPGYGVLLRACAMSETVSAGVKVDYAPISDTLESCTIYFNEDGVLHKMKGCRGSVSIKMAAGQIPTYSFKFVGVYVPPTDTVAPSPVDYTIFQVPLVVNNTNTTGLSLYSTTTFALESFNFDVANDTPFRSLVGAEYTQITDRKPKGDITIEAVAIAVKDFFTISQNNTTGAFLITQGTTAGNKVVLSIPYMDVDAPTYEDSSGVNMLKMGFSAIPTAGNDEFKITVQ